MPSQKQIGPDGGSMDNRHLLATSSGAKTNLLAQNLYAPWQLPQTSLIDPSATQDTDLFQATMLYDVI